jgi:hypothetical protein
MKLKYLVTALIIFGILVLVGCTPTQTQQAASVFIGGNEGVTAKFEPMGVEEQSIYSIFDSETFPLEVTLQNKGEYEIQPGEVKVKLMGPSANEFQGIPSWELQNKEKVDPKSELVPTGGEETLSFASEAKYKNKVTTLLDRQWFANIEYRYQTFLILPSVCLKEDPADTRVCEIKGAKEFFVSGAPVTVTSVEEDVSGKGIMALKINIKKSGSGKLTLPNQDFSVNTERLAFTIDDSEWECKSGGKLNEARLQDGAAEIVCKLKNPLSKGTLETKKIGLTLDYKYRDTIQETLRIKESSS